MVVGHDMWMFKAVAVVAAALLKLIPAPGLLFIFVVNTAVSQIHRRYHWNDSERWIVLQDIRNRSVKLGTEANRKAFVTFSHNVSRGGEEILVKSGREGTGGKLCVILPRLVCLSVFA